MFGRCEVANCGAVGFASFTAVTNSRPYDIEKNGVVERRYTKSQVVKLIACAACGFELINKKFSVLLDKGTPHEHWRRGAYYSEVRQGEILPTGKAFLEMGLEWQIREKHIALEASDPEKRAGKKRRSTSFSNAAVTVGAASVRRR